MNIGIVTTWFERGAGYVSKRYVKILEKEHNIFIYARGGEKYAIGEIGWDEPRVTWGKKIPLHMPMSIDLVDFKKWIENNKIDTVIFNEQQWWDPVVLCSKLGVKCGAYVDYYTKETVPFFGVYDFLICNTRRHFNVFSWHSQAIYIPWGNDLDLFKPASFELSEKNVVSFFHSCGVSPERKGTDLLLQAFGLVDGTAKLIIHTQIDLHVFYPQLKDLIGDLEKRGKLLIKMATVPAPGLYFLGDVYVYPTRLDGLGLTMTEALACGLPLVVPDNGPMNEFINEESGKLIKIDKYSERADKYFWPQCEINKQSLVDAMQFYVDHKDMVVDFKIKARKFAEKNLNWVENSKDLSKKIADFKILYGKETVIKDIKKFEESRSNWQTKLYRRCPILFKPFNWFWPIIKKIL